MSIAFVAAGFVVGVLVGLTGVGGGSVMTPILVLVFGIHTSTAIGTDLLFAAATKTAGTLVHGVSRTVEWRIVGLLSAGSLPGAVVALGVLGAIGVHGAPANTLSTVLLGVMLVIAAVSLAAKPWITRRGALAAHRHHAPPPWLTVVLGVVLGVTVTFSSVGAGAMGTVALIFLYPGLSLREVVGSDIAHAVLLTLVAGFGRLWLHSADLGLLAALLTGSIPGIVLGSLLVRVAPERFLRIALAVMLGAVGVRMLFKLA